MTDPTFKSNRVAEIQNAACLNDDQGIAWARGMGEVQDNEAALLRTAAVARFPQLCPDDALDLCGTWINLPRFDGEPDGTTTSGYRGRLCNAWPTWEKAGTPQSIIDSLHAYGIEDVAVYRDYDGAFMPGDWYSRFWVVLGPAMPFEPTLLGSITLGEFYLGSTATPSQIKAIKQQILFWKDVRGYPVSVVLRFSNVDPPTGFDPTIGAIIMGGGASFVNWEIGRIFGLDTFMPFPLGGFNI